jgi:hypothetical protein
MRGRTTKKTDGGMVGIQTDINKCKLQTGKRGKKKTADWEKSIKETKKACIGL